ncbi:hypothetical protein Hanom_Chr08g00688331 [Helianthus anomalus]
MSNNLQVLKILSIPIGFGCSTKLSMVFIKHRELGTQPYLLICWRTVFAEVLSTVLSSSKNKMEIFFWYRYTLMILFLVLLMMSCVGISSA